ncbi:MAG: hypothetical protein ACMZI0_01780 [Symbiopectobacterium sp.]|uniref:hypothetical protein n=1 Tax=Symbiopectobacterium sp. TaxID=2952789 RepID=UPI0039EB68F5
MFNQKKHTATTSLASNTEQHAYEAAPSSAEFSRQKIMTTLAHDAERQVNKCHLLRLGAEKRSTRPAISQPMLGKLPASNIAVALTATSPKETLTKAEAIVDNAVTKFGIVEKGMTDPKYASQAIDSALSAIYSNHKDNFLKRLEQSAKPVQNELLSTLPDNTKREIRQVLSGAQTSQPQQTKTKVTGALDKLEQIKNKPFVKAFGMSKVVNLLQKGIVRIAGRGLFRNSLQDAVANAYQEGRNASLAKGSLKALDAVTQEITQHQRGSAGARASSMPYPYTALETVTHQAVLNHLLKTKGHARDNGNTLSAAAQIAYHKGLCDGIRNAYLHTIGTAAQEAGLSGNAPDRSDKAFTPTGAGANPYIRPMLDAVAQLYPDALMNPEIKEQLSKHAHDRLIAEIDVLSRDLKPILVNMSHPEFDNNPALKTKLQNLMNHSSKCFTDNLATISTRFEGLNPY